MWVARVWRDDAIYFARVQGENVLLTDAADLLSVPEASEIERVSKHEVRFVAPLSAPSKIVCVGRNYAKHAKELGNDVPDEPTLFLKPSSSIIGPEEAIVLPPQSDLVHHEAELAMIIGKRMKNVSCADAMAGVFGFTLANDVTARDLQRKDGKFTRAKGFDSFCPIGPVVETEFADAQNAQISLKVNGEVRQNANTADMVFKLPFLVHYISSIMTLLPGDLILTGTPEGVGPLKAGDRVEVAIPGLGMLVNRVESA